MRLELINPQKLILEELQNTAFVKRSIASTYAHCIIQQEDVDFRVVNNAIINRWSKSGLVRQKEKAWKLLEAV